MLLREAVVGVKRVYIGALDPVSGDGEKIDGKVIFLEVAEGGGRGGGGGGRSSVGGVVGNAR